MAQEVKMEPSQQTSISGEEKTSPSVIEIYDSITECEEEETPTELQMEDKTFVSSLHSFMKDKGTPIERIPHLGFKQINLWRIYKIVDKIGGYDSVTARRLWKKVYDELGGSPGSTSAATCTRRHYERLVLPFERYLKGEEDKPVPSSKPRKPYKRSLNEILDKAEGKRKRAFTDKDIESKTLHQKSSQTASSREAAMLPHSTLWAASSDPPFSHCSLPNKATSDLCASYYSHIHQVQTSTTHTSHSVREAISPLEKKKQMAQASLSLPRSSQCKDKERPSVIHRWPSSSKICSSSDSSPQPPSSSSSRSPSPLSAPSEDETADREDKAGLLPNFHRSEEIKTETSQNTPRQNKNVFPARSQSLNSVKSPNKNSAWKPYLKGTYSPLPLQPSTSFSSPTCTSSFTKVVPKSVQLQRATPIQPSYKSPQKWMRRQSESQVRDKMLSHANLGPYQTDTSSTTPQKVYPSQQNVGHLSSWTSRYPPPLHPVVLRNRMRLPQSQLMYGHIPVGPAFYSYPYTAPLLHPPMGYSIPAINPIYSHKM